jgi:zinc/manganese transport system substrate-binding protein
MHFKNFIRRTTTASLLAAVGALLCVVPASASEKPLDVVTTTPNLAALVKTIGDDAVRVRSLARPGEDPHFVEARPSFVRLLHAADLLVVIGLDLGIGYLPALLRQARNPRIQPGGAGYFDASEGVNTILPPNAGIMARAMGDVHPRGNPHYLTDPVEGLRVTRRLVEKLSQLAPKHLQEVIGQMKREDVRLILSSSYFRDQYAKKVAAETGAGIAVMVDQVGLIDEANTSYLDMIQMNLDRVRKALKP